MGANTANCSGESGVCQQYYQSQICGCQTLADIIVQKLHGTSEFIWKIFQAAQLTHERFLTIDHSYKIFFDIRQTEL